MGLLHLLKDERFNIFFSFLVGLGIVCIIRPQCKDKECAINKPPAEKDFDKFVYRMPGNKCFEFKTEVVSCPSSGAIEAFRENQNSNETFHDSFSRRVSPILTCE